MFPPINSSFVAEMHYEALELSTTASAAEIRRAYRRLVLLTHPDRTPDPAAHARYLAINAAYKVLSDPAQRIAYDASMRRQSAMVVAMATPGRARDAAYRTARASRLRRPSVAPLTVRYAEEYARALRIARPFLIACLLLCVSLAVDFFLAKERTEKVLSTETDVKYTRRGVFQTTAYLTDYGTFSHSDELPIGTHLLVTRTPLWGTALAARLPEANSSFGFSSVYQGTRNAFWLGLLLSATLGLVPRLTDDHRLIASMLSVVFLALTLVQMFL